MGGVVVVAVAAIVVTVVGIGSGGGGVAVDDLLAGCSGSGTLILVQSYQ